MDLEHARENEPLRSCSARKFTLLRAGSDDNGKVVGLAKASVKENVVVHVLGAVVTDNAQKTDLVVDDEQSGIVLVNPLKLVRND